MVECPKCNGNCKAQSGRNCPACNGNGKVTKEQATNIQSVMNKLNKGNRKKVFC